MEVVSARSGERVAGSGTYAESLDCRRDFPILSTRVRGGESPLVYLDNAATTHKPQVVIDATSRYYAEENANIHRGVHWLSEQATIAYDRVREQARAFLGAAHAHEIIFTRGTTDGINLVASSFGDTFVGAGDEILVTEMEHHSNLVPWQLACERRGARVRAVPVTSDGELDLDALGSLLGPQTRLLALTQLSNVLGTVNPLDAIIALAHERGVPVLVDGAQSAPRMPVDVLALGCDFFVCSGHKNVRADGRGTVVRARGAAEPYAAVPGRRRHDRNGQDRAQHLRAASRQVRGRDAEHRRRRRPGCRVRVDRGAGTRAYRRPRARAARVRARAAR